MMRPFDLSRFASAAQRFRDFFAELRSAFVERDAILRQIELALLSREHVLMTGPPGTGKSQLTGAVLGRIVDENTGAPSVFARQFTENSVQTDLVGPINFKSLMETGRTEHFTDEGILGSVHGFLDEVFDGRDMLLRSTLNLLHEREFKQGGVITRGQIECAIMTSNRYLAEVLESSRETLLAFVDRVAFVSFVPRGFADAANLARVVRQHGGGRGRQELSAPLSIQDLDVLQAAVEHTHLADSICDSLTALLHAMDVEVAETMRADPNFQPTRYLSTRTAVRAANILRALAVRNTLSTANELPDQVHFHDLDGLRYHLLLTGLNRDQIEARMAQEHDPRERRQLEIMRTEGEIFARCLAKLESVEVGAVPTSQSTELSNSALHQIKQRLGKARESGDSKELVALVRALSNALHTGKHDAAHLETADGLLRAAMGTLSEQALRAGLHPSLRPGVSINKLVSTLSQTADNLERASFASRPMARWLRGRLLTLIDESLRLTPALTAESVSVLVSEANPVAIEEQAESRLATIENLASLRTGLHAAGVWLDDVAYSEGAWTTALERLERELALLWDALFRDAAKDILADAGRRPLGEVLASLSAFVARIDKIEQRYRDMGATSTLRKRVLGPRLEALVETGFTRLQARNRKDLIAEVKGVLVTLRQHGLDDVIEPDDFVMWVIPRLIEQEQERGRPSSYEIRNQDDYGRLHAIEDPLSLAETLIDIAIQVLPAEARDPENPQDATASVWALLRSLPHPIQDEIVGLDLARIERGLNYLDAWWQHFRARITAARSDSGAAVTLLEEVVSSGFLRAMRSDAEPLRLALEAEHLGEVFPVQADRIRLLRQRIERFDTDSTAAFAALLQHHAHRTWGTILAGGKDSI